MDNIRNNPVKQGKRQGKNAAQRDQQAWKQLSDEKKAQAADKLIDALKRDSNSRS